MRKSKGKYVHIDVNKPEAVGACDKTGFIFNKSDLVQEVEWRGNSLQPTGFLVGKPFVDKPNEQGRTPLLREDPVPVKNPRPPLEKGFFTEPPPPLSNEERLANLRAFSWSPYTKP